jgi:serine/threonine protein kinase
VTDDTAAKFDVLSLSDAELIDTVCDRFESDWRAGNYPCLEGYLDAVPESCRATLVVELIKLEIELRTEVGERPTEEEYRLRFADHAAAIRDIVHERRKLERARSTSLDQRDASLLSVPASGDVTTTAHKPWWDGEAPGSDALLFRQMGNYLILEKIGSGGQGVVYRALEQNAGRYVAIKAIKADWLGDATLASNEEARTRFRTEAQNHALLDHDHIVPVYHVGESGGVLYIVMRLIRGISLADLVKRDGPMPPRRAAYLLEPIARAIQHAHDHGLLHRDVKPGNVLVGEHDRPYLIDLGLAKCLEATDYTSLSGKAIGTAAYMSPEQARGQSGIGFASDVYGLGATLFTLLTGRPPFPGDKPLVILRKVIDEEPAWPSDRNKPVGRELKAICLKCLEKNPSDRFATASELADELRRYLDYLPCQTKPPAPWLRPYKWARRKPWRAAAAVLGCLAILLAISSLAWNARRDRLEADAFLRDLPGYSLAQLPAMIDGHGRDQSRIHPALRSLLVDARDDSEYRTRLLLALSRFEPERVPELADRLLSCQPDEHRAICETLEDRWNQVAPRLRAVLADPATKAPTRIRAAAALIPFENAQAPENSAWAELRFVSDPGARTELLQWLARSEISTDRLAARFEIEPDISVRRQIIQLMGASKRSGNSPGASLAGEKRLWQLYRDDRDAGIHSSLAYLFRRWGRNDELARIDHELAGSSRGDRQWFVNSVGLTMAIVPIGSAPVPTRLAVATTETPMALYAQSDDRYPALRRFQCPDKEPPDVPDAPADCVSYFEAARFCNWLSLREGFPPAELCYIPGNSDEKLVLAPNWKGRHGYRLPSVEEWELAARAGTTTSCYFGDRPDLLEDYAWSYENSPRSASRARYAGPVGRHRPNDFGLFDVIGNMSEWCYNPSPPDDEKATGGPLLKFPALKGGSFAFVRESQGVNAARGQLDRTRPAYSGQMAGFRIVRAGL